MHLKIINPIFKSFFLFFDVLFKDAEHQNVVLAFRTEATEPFWTCSRVPAFKNSGK